MEKRKSNAPWGTSASIDLKSCDSAKIRDKDEIFLFSKKICKLINMKPYGEPLIINFGEDPRVSGYTLVQLIETSSITAHFVNQSNAIYLDIFSCNKFDSNIVAEFTKIFFNADSYIVDTKNRY